MAQRITRQRYERSWSSLFLTVGRSIGYGTWVDKTKDDKRDTRLCSLSCLY